MTSRRNFLKGSAAFLGTVAAPLPALPALPAEYAKPVSMTVTGTEALTDHFLKMFNEEVKKAYENQVLYGHSIVRMHVDEEENIQIKTLPPGSELATVEVGEWSGFTFVTPGRKCGKTARYGRSPAMSTLPDVEKLKR